MRFTRILDLAVIVLLATVVLMPRPDVTVKAALRLDPERRDRVAELQSVLIGHADAVDPALELANVYLDGHRPDWALATVNGALDAHPDDYRLHQLRAIAYADRFEGQPAYEAARKAVAACDRSTTCGDAAHARLALLEKTLQAVSRVDMRKQPYLAKERILEQLHPVYMPKSKQGAAAAKKPAPEKVPSKPPGP